MDPFSTLAGVVVGFLTAIGLGWWYTKTEERDAMKREEGMGQRMLEKTRFVPRPTFDRVRVPNMLPEEDL